MQKIIGHLGGFRDGLMCHRSRGEIWQFLPIQVWYVCVFYICLCGGWWCTGVYKYAQCSTGIFTVSLLVHYCAVRIHTALNGYERIWYFVRRGFVQHSNSGEKKIKGKNIFLRNNNFRSNVLSGITPGAVEGEGAGEGRAQCGQTQSVRENRKQCFQNACPSMHWRDSPFSAEFNSPWFRLFTGVSPNSLDYCVFSKWIKLKMDKKTLSWSSSANLIRQPWP